MQPALFFDEALLRLKRHVGTLEDQQVADLLGLKKAAFSARKSRGSFPEKELRALAQQRPDLRIDVGYVLTGVSSAASDATAVLRECTEQVMLLGLPSTASIAVRDIVFGTRTGNAQMVHDGLALLSGSAPVAHVQAPAPKPKPAPNSIQVGNMTNHAAGGVQIGHAGGSVRTKTVAKVSKSKE